MSQYNATIKLKITRDDLIEVYDENTKQYYTKIDKDKIQAKISKIVETLKDVGVKREALQQIGEKILEFAKENVANYYINQGAKYSGDEPQKFEPLADSSQELYDQIGRGNQAGLDTGASKIIEVLDIGSGGNVFETENDYIEVGFRSALAVIHELGGFRLKGKHAGQGELDDWARILDPSGEFRQDDPTRLDPNWQPFIPPRPFFLPAFFHVRDSKESGELYPMAIMPYLKIISEDLKEIDCDIEDV